MDLISHVTFEYQNITNFKSKQCVVKKTCFIQENEIMHFTKWKHNLNVFLTMFDCFGSSSSCDDSLYKKRKTFAISSLEIITL